MTPSISKRKWRLLQCLSSFNLDEGAFCKWLDRKAKAHVRRDKQRGFHHATVPSYKQAILDAIERSQGCDCYTGEKLDWARIGQWRNAEAAERRGDYRREFWMLPSVDHDFTDPNNHIFRICSWRTNDSKNDQSIEEFLALADSVRRHLLVSRV
jgi:hypothetical protein